MFQMIIPTYASLIKHRKKINQGVNHIIDQAYKYLPSCDMSNNMRPSILHQFDNSSYCMKAV